MTLRKAILIFLSIFTLCATESLLGASAEPFDSPTGDNLDLCEYKIAHSFRYDFNRVETPAAEQALAAFHQHCRSELAAMRALLPNWNTPRNNGETIATRVDDNALIDFENAQNDISFDENPRVSPLNPGESVVNDRGRLSIFAHPSPISDSEIATIVRHDALGWSPDFGFSGAIAGWKYSYEPDSGSGRPPQRWSASLKKQGTDVYISCNSLGSADNACRLDFQHSGRPRGMGFLSLRGGGQPFAVHEICNPGGTGIVVDAPEPDDIKARHASLTVDDQYTIALPDGDGCAPDAGGTFVQHLLSAHTVRARYAPPFRERIIEVEGAADVLRPALAVAQQTYDATRIEMGSSRFLAEMAAISDRAKPFTIPDALAVLPDWKRARDCLATHGLNSEVCHNELADLDERAASIDSLQYHSLDDDPAFVERARPHIAIARKAVVDDAERQILSAQSHFTSQFRTNDRPTMVMGHQGFSGIGDNAFYGYFLASDTAEGAVIGRFSLNIAANGTRRGFPTTRIRCHAASSRSCTVFIPFEDTAGGLRIETDGGRADANVCVEVPLRNWSGRMLVKEYSTAGWRLDENHCAGKKSKAVLATFLDHSGVRLRGPGESSDIDSDRTYPNGFEQILALTNYLSAQVNLPR